MDRNLPRDCVLFRPSTVALVEAAVVVRRNQLAARKKPWTKVAPAQMAVNQGSLMTLGITTQVSVQLLALVLVDCKLVVSRLQGLEQNLQLLVKAVGTLTVRMVGQRSLL